MTILRGTFTSKKGTDLHYRMEYDKGGTSPYGRPMKRGYRLFIQRDKTMFTVHEGLASEKVAVNVFLHEVKRMSQKQADIAVSMVTDEFMQSIADRYGL